MAEDDNHFMGIASNGFSLKGRKKTATGAREDVEIIYSFEKHADRDHIGNSDFSAWLRQRTAPGVRPLVYVNTSCWSIFKAADELRARLEIHA